MFSYYYIMYVFTYIIHAAARPVSLCRVSCRRAPVSRSEYFVYNPGFVYNPHFVYNSSVVYNDRNCIQPPRRGSPGVRAISFKIARVSFFVAFL